MKFGKLIESYTKVVCEKKNVFFFVQCLFKFVQLTTSNLVEIQDIAESKKKFLK